MNGTPFLDRLFRTTSWFIVFALLYSAVSVIIAKPSGAGPVASSIGIIGAQIFYFLLYTGESVSLAYSKMRKRSRWRKNTLLVIYLTGFFTSVLTIMLKGWIPELLDNLAISVAAAGCWLYWTFKTEYLTAEQFKDFSEEPQD